MKALAYDGCMRLLSWIKANKLSSLLILAVLLLVLKKSSGITPVSLSRMEASYDVASDMAVQQTGIRGGLGAVGKMVPPIVSDEYAPAPDVKNRMVIKDSYLSLLVKNVRETVDQMNAYAVQQGGYMVSSTLDNPGESPSGNLILRIPQEKLETALNYFRGLSVKVVSENLTGRDVTDQYVDNEARLATLVKTQARLQELQDASREISDLLNIQQQLISLQSQIDAVKGQQQYLEQSAKMAKITIYLSSDEYALPYAPNDAWSASAIFKLAVRSLVTNLRSFAAFAIWAAVYAVIWIPVLIIAWYVYRRFLANTDTVRRS